MSLVQKTIGNKTYYTDGTTFYTFHVVKTKSDPFWKFAAQDLGINKAGNFTPDEQKRINDLAGTGMYQKTQYLLLKNGRAAPMPYKLTVPDVKPGDVILRRVPPPATGLVKCPHCASSVVAGPTCSACGKPLKP